MAIPRSVGNGLNSIPEPNHDDDIFNPFLGDEEGDTSLYPISENLEVEDDTFIEDSLPPAAETIPRSLIQNLDDEDLDTLLGLNEVPPTINNEVPRTINTDNDDENDELPLPPINLTETSTQEPTDAFSDLEQLIAELDDEPDYTEIENLIKTPPQKQKNQQKTIEENISENSDTISLNNIEEDVNDEDEALPDFSEIFDNEESFNKLDENSNSLNSDTFAEDWDNLDPGEDDHRDLISFGDEEDDEDDDEESDNVSDGDFSWDEEFEPPINPFSNVFPTDTEYEDWDDFDDEEDEETFEENVEIVDETTDTDSSVGELETTERAEPGVSILGKLKEKFAVIKAQVVADAKGDSIPDDIPDYAKPVEQDIPDYAKPLDDDLSDDNDSEKEPEKKPKAGKRRKSKAGKRRIPKVFAPLGRLYTFFVNIFFNILSTIFGILAKLPLIGGLFKPLVAATSILRNIASMLPVVTVLGLIIAFSYFSVSSSVSGEYPDEGSVVFTDFSYSDGVASGSLVNTGPVVLEVSPSFDVYTLQPGLNPLTWFIPEQVLTCSVEPVTVDIDDSVQVSASCSGAEGFLPRVSGVLE